MTDSRLVPIDLSNLPLRLQRLPVFRGFPVPWFVCYVNGEPEFRAMDAGKWRQAISDSLCWVCGERLGRHRVFVLGPMCGINRTTSEPPCHAGCAEWSARHCPFLSRPHMVRRDATALLTEGGAEEAAGIGLLRNPGVALLWWTQAYETFRAHVGQAGLLIRVGDPTQVRWFCEGRAATRAEVVASIESGLPALREKCEQEPMPWNREAAHAELTARARAFEALYPRQEGF